MMTLFEDFPASALGLETGVSLLTALCSAEDAAKDGGAAAAAGAHNDGDDDSLSLTREDRDGVCDDVLPRCTRANHLQLSYYLCKVRAFDCGNHHCHSVFLLVRTMIETSTTYRCTPMKKKSYRQQHARNVFFLLFFSGCSSEFFKLHKAKRVCGLWFRACMPLSIH